MTCPRVWLVCLAACLTGAPLPAQQLVGLTVAPTSVRVPIGGVATLEVSVVRRNGVTSRARAGTVRFASSDPIVALVDSAGRVTGRSAGIAVLTVSYETAQRSVPVRL